MIRKNLLAITLLTLSLCGCGRSQPSQFYLLTEMAPKASQVRAEPLDIGIGPITLPRYLNTPQIVTREHNNQLKLHEHNRWAEPLDDNVKRVLGDNLLALLPASRVFNHPWQRRTPIDYQVMLDVRRFEMDERDDCILVAHWTIFKGDKQKSLLVRDKTYRLHTCEYQNYQQIARLMSRNLLRLSKDIARDIQRRL